jgi:hypothetical protein
MTSLYRSEYIFSPYVFCVLSLSKRIWWEFPFASYEHKHDIHQHEKKATDRHRKGCAESWGWLSICRYFQSLNLHFIFLTTQIFIFFPYYICRQAVFAKTQSSTDDTMEMQMEALRATKEGHKKPFNKDWGKKMW